MYQKHIFIALLLLLPFLASATVPNTFSGKIIDSKTGNIIVGASISIEDTRIGTFSDRNGEFILYLGKGEFKVLVTATGYTKLELLIELNENIEQDILLEPSLNERNQIFRLRAQNQVVNTGNEKALAESVSLQ